MTYTKDEITEMKRFFGIDKPQYSLDPEIGKRIKGIESKSLDDLLENSRRNVVNSNYGLIEFVDKDGNYISAKDGKVNVVLYGFDLQSYKTNHERTFDFHSSSYNMFIIRRGKDKVTLFDSAASKHASADFLALANGKLHIGEAGVIKQRIDMMLTKEEIAERTGDLRGIKDTKEYLALLYKTSEGDSKNLLESYIDELNKREREERIKVEMEIRRQERERISQLQKADISKESDKIVYFYQNGQVVGYLDPPKEAEKQVKSGPTGLSMQGDQFILRKNGEIVGRYDMGPPSLSKRIRRFFRGTK